MKTNLKTFPKLLRDDDWKEAQYQKWKETFENELRERIETQEKCLGAEAWRSILIMREIVGDE